MTSVNSAAVRSVEPGVKIFLLGASVTLLAGVIATPVMASGSAETCRGLAATITGTGTSPVVGTEGPDVIVALGGGSVQALGGDDVICLRSAGAFVVAGSGDDIVDATAARGFTGVILGAGSDTFLGGPADDQVWGAGNGSTSPGFDDVDTEPDTITTGRGTDLVSSGAADSINHDQIATGPGADRVALSSQLAADGRLDVGSGANTVGITLGAAGAWGVDVLERTITYDGEVTTWSGTIADYAIGLAQESSPSTLSFDGSHADESLSVSGPLTANLHMRGGNDSISVSVQLGAGSVYSLGPGRDALSLGSFDTDGGRFSLPSLSVDLDDHRADYGARGTSPGATVNGVEDLHASAVHLRAAGTGKGDRISAGGCVVDVDGRQGADRLIRLGIGYRHCATVRTRLFGGPGDDRLLGAKQTDDVLVGGAGRDVAVGGEGTDTCRAEVTRECE